MHSRRNFIGKVATGLGTFGRRAQPCARCQRSCPVRLHRLRNRATDLLNQLRVCPETEAVAFCDVYTKQLDRAKTLVPTAKTYLDHRRMLEDRSIDAVLIATPQHLHAEHFCARSTLESTSTRKRRWRSPSTTPSECARRIRKPAANASCRSGIRCMFHGPMRDVPSHRRSGTHGQDHRDPHAYVSQHAARQAAVVAPVDAGYEPGKYHVEIVPGRAPAHDFDANRYINWRYFWDYSGGNVYENMCHQVEFWYKALKLQIPRQSR